MHYPDIPDIGLGPCLEIDQPETNTCYMDVRIGAVVKTEDADVLRAAAASFAKVIGAFAVGGEIASEAAFAPHKDAQEYHRDRLEQRERAMLAQRASFKLSDQEVRVIECAVQGLSNAEIAQALFLAAATVKSHLSRAGVKMGTGDRVKIVGLYNGTIDASQYRI